MIDTVIVSGGNIQKDFALGFLRKAAEEAGRENLLVIAADRGLEFFAEAGLRPDMAVGDFDSLCASGREFLARESGIEVLALRPEKDDSDTQAAVCAAMERGAEDIAVLGATGSRVDHMLANLGLLSLGAERGVRITLADSRNYITLVESGTVLLRDRQFGDYVSFFPVGGNVEGLTLEGFQYPLSEYCLRPSDSGLTVSNEIRKEKARVTFRKGTLLMIMSRD